MASTGTYSGYEMGKPSSKVMAPPGGRSNNIFGEPTDYQSPPQAQQPGGDASSNANETTGLRLFGETPSPASANKQACDDNKVSAAAAGVNTHAGNRRNHVTYDQEEEDNAVITHCRKRFFKNEGRDEEEEETEEEKRKREEEEEKKKAQVAGPARAKPPRGAYNPITGEAYPDQAQESSTTRVRQPPGGKSSGPLW